MKRNSPEFDRGLYSYGMETSTEGLYNLANGSTITSLELRKIVKEAGARGIEDVRFCEWLVIRGVLEPDALKAFIDEAGEKQTDLFNLAVAKEYITEKDRATILAARYKLDVVDLSSIQVDKAVAQLLPQAQAIALVALPFAQSPEGVIFVAVADPSNVKMVNDLPHLLRSKPTLFVAPETALRHAIAGAYSGTEQAAAAGSATGKRGGGNRGKDEEAERQRRREERIFAGTGDSIGLSDASDEEIVEANIRAGGGDTAVVGMLNAMIASAVSEGASDIHIEPTGAASRVRFRIDGVLSDVDTIPVQLRDRVISRIKVMANLKIDERRVPQDGRASVETPEGRIDLRIATLPLLGGERVSMRLIDPRSSELTLDHLGLEGRNLELFNQAIAKPWGAIVVTGPTGSGKSTTLYSALGKINKPGVNIITVEDPVEQRLAGISQVQVNERQGMTFAGALRSILRSDPDVVMIGEIRDQETAKIAIESALTGHLVLTTLHTKDSASAVSRLIEMGVEPFLISNSVELILAQRLARKLCQYCRQEFPASRDELIAMQAPAWAIKQAESGPVMLYEAKVGGCGQCHNRGYRGRTGIHEALPLTESLRRAVITGVSVEEISRIALQEGMITLREDAFRKVIAGTTSLQELARVVA